MEEQYTKQNDDYTNDELKFLCPVCMNNIGIRIIRRKKSYGEKTTIYELRDEEGAYRKGALAHLALHGMKLPEDKENA